MASSAVSSVMGKPLKAGSCFGFLSFAAAAGMEAMAGVSTPRENTQAIDKNAASNALGRRETVAIWGCLRRSAGASFGWLGFIRAPYKINPMHVEKLRTLRPYVECGASGKKLKNNG